PSPPPPVRRSGQAPPACSAPSYPLLELGEAVAAVSTEIACLPPLLEFGEEAADLGTGGDAESGDVAALERKSHGPPSGGEREELRHARGGAAFGGAQQHEIAVEIGAEV